MSKKILICNIGTEIGGIEKCLINFLKYLETKECEVDLVLWKPNGPLYDQIPSFVNIIDSPGPGSFSKIKKEKNLLKLFFRLYKYVKFKTFAKFSVPWKSLRKNKKHYDIAISYCQNGYSPYYIIDNVNAKDKYLWYHELNYLCDKKKKKFDEKYFSRFSNIICVSDACRVNLTTAFPTLSEKFITLYNFYDIEEIKQKAELESNPYNYPHKNVIATVGRLSKEKGVTLAIDTCNELLKYRDDFVWCWIGDGPEKAFAESKIKEYGLEEHLVLMGNKTNPYIYMKNCDLYVQPSLSEAYCTTIIEAMILRKNIVCTNVDSVYEQVIDGKNALISQIDYLKLCDRIIESFNYSYDVSESYIKLNNRGNYDLMFFD